MFRRGIAAVALGCALVAGGALTEGPLGARPSAAAYLPGERIPTDDPLYRDLERLAATYGATPRFLSMRPLRRAEALAFLDELAGLPAGDGDRSPADDPAYVRARRALDPDAPGGVAPLVSTRGEEGEAIQISPYVAFLYSDDPRNRPDINRDYRVGGVLAAEFDSSATIVADIYAGTASQGGRGTPNFGTFNALVEGVDFNTWVNEAYVEARLGPLRALAGHTWLRWGPGREGTLALSDAAPALDMVRFEATALKSWRVQWFVSLLDPGLETYLAGHRIEWTPGRGGGGASGGAFTAGFTELARFDGTSQAPLYMMPLVPYSFWEKRPKTAQPGAVPGDTSGVALAKNNVLWSADFAWTPRPGWRAWGEFLLDDISFSRDYKPDMIGYQAGVEHRRAVRSGRNALGVAIEFSRVNNFTYSAFHGHHFAHEGYPVGFVLGPDVASLSGEIAYEMGAAWEIRLRGEWRKKGDGGVGDAWERTDGRVLADAYSGRPERESRWATTVIYAPNRSIRIEGRAGIADFTSYLHSSTQYEDEPFSLAMRLAW